MDTSVRRWLAAVLVALLVASAALAGPGAAQQPDDSDGVSPADEIYVEDDGDAVLVYEPADTVGTDAPERTEFGLDVTEDLVYGLLEDPVEGTPDVRGTFSATAAPARVDASGSLSGPQPDFVESLDVSFSGESTSEQARSDLTLDATFADEAGWSQLVRSASTSGEVTTTASSFRLTGEFQADSAVPLGADQRVAATLREGEEAYTLSVERDQLVGAMEAESWENRSVAAQTLETRFGAFAETLDGTASVSIDSLSLAETDGERSRLDVAYTVTYRGIDEGLGTTLREALAEDSRVSEDQADRLASELRAATIDEASFTYEMTNGDPAGTLTLELSEYDGLLLAYFDVAGSLEGDVGDAYARNAELYRKQLEAQAAAGLEQRFTWSGNLSHPDDESVSVDVEYHARSENWAAYVDELEARDVPRSDAVYDLTASSDGDRLSLEGSAELRGEDLFQQFTRGLNGTAAEDPEFAEAIDAFRDAGLQKAKLETSYDGEGLRLEFGAAFQDLAALRDALADEHDLPAVGKAVTRSEDNGSVTYVRVNGAVGADASTADVRALSVADDDTTVHLPGEWDREFPSMDADRARSFLELDGAGGSLPGFGPVVAVVALLATALLVRRRG